jgi:hypothetical protein
MLIQTPKKAIKIGYNLKATYISIFILCLLASVFSCGPTSNAQQENPLKICIEIPDSLEVDSIEKFNVNNATIEIYTAYNRNKTTTYEYWYVGGKQIHFVDYPIFDINYKWLVDLVDDGELEVIRAQGYEDGVDYGIFDINKNSEEQLICFNPALLDERYPNKTFWGFPRDMERPVMNKKKQILSSFQTYSERDDNYSIPERQKQIPYIFFYGKTTQPHAEIEIEHSKREYVALKKMISKSYQINNSKIEIVNGQWQPDCEKRSGYFRTEDEIVELQLRIGEVGVWFVFLDMKKGESFNEVLLYFNRTNYFDFPLGEQGEGYESPPLDKDISSKQVVGKLKLISENEFQLMWYGLYDRKSDKVLDEYDVTFERDTENRILLNICK